MPLDFPRDQLPCIRALLADMRPGDELAYRLALRGMFARCRNTEFNVRIEALLAELVSTPADLERYMKRAQQIAGNLDSRATVRPARH